MKRVLVYTAVAVVLFFAAFTPFLVLSLHPRHPITGVKFCCKLEPVSNAQELHARIDTRAMCGDRHGAVIEVDGLYTDCIVP